MLLEKFQPSPKRYSKLPINRKSKGHVEVLVICCEKEHMWDTTFACVLSLCPGTHLKRLVQKNYFKNLSLHDRELGIKVTDDHKIQVRYRS